MWKQIPSHPAYEASHEGHVRGVRGRVLQQTPHPQNGRLRVRLCVDGRQSWRSVAAIVLEAFIGPRPAGAHAAHNDGNRINNRIVNLRWATAVANEADKKRHGTQARGESHGKTSLTEADVRRIRSMVPSGARRLKYGAAAQLARELGVSKTTVARIANRKAWAHVE